MLDIGIFSGATLNSVGTQRLNFVRNEHAGKGLTDIIVFSAPGVGWDSIDVTTFREASWRVARCRWLYQGLKALFGPWK